ncbi:YeiH family protein [Hyphomicrobium sp.]|uniref:YeiH family protein n=1 Tax=Hyphomicrobium sp. TaxID=82 RepID=UPI002FDDB770
MDAVVSARTRRAKSVPKYWQLAPGFLLALSVAAISVLLAPHMPAALPLPAMVIALIIAMALHGVTRNAAFEPGIALCAKPLLRWAVALLGMRVALGDIIGLGAPVAMAVVAAMIVTIVAGVAIAKALKLNTYFGLLVGSATAVCGASATLATSTVLPSYKGRDTDIAFVIVGVNLLATVGMLAFPPLCMMLGFDDRTTGIMLGGTIHDVAQVVGAGYAVSETAGNSAAIVKLFRVFLLLPVVLAISWYAVKLSGNRREARVAVPVFAIVFLVLCILNSILSTIDVISVPYDFAKSVVVELSTWGLLLAIAAIGLNTSLKAIAELGWRHIVILIGTALVILTAMTALLMLLY